MLDQLHVPDVMDYQHETRRKASGDQYQVKKKAMGDQNQMREKGTDVLNQAGKEGTTNQYQVGEKTMKNRHNQQEIAESILVVESFLNQKQRKNILPHVEPNDMNVVNTSGDRNIGPNKKRNVYPSEKTSKQHQGNDNIDKSPDQKETSKHQKNTERQDQDQNVYIVYPENSIGSQKIQDSYPNIQDSFSNNIQDIYSNNIQDSYSSNIQNTYPNNIQDSYPNNIQDNYPNNIQDTYPNNILNSYPNNIQDSYPNNIQNYYPNNLQDSYSNNIQDNYPNNIKNNYPNNFKDPYPINIQNTYPNNIQDSYPINIQDTYTNTAQTTYPSNIQNTLPINSYEGNPQQNSFSEQQFPLNKAVEEHLNGKSENVGPLVLSDQSQAYDPSLDSSDQNKHFANTAPTGFFSSVSEQGNVWLNYY